jgi:hypothetical protein
MKDQWNEQLRCAECGRTGMASLSQVEGALPIIESVPEGFKAVATKHGPDFMCASCNIPATP